MRWMNPTLRTRINALLGHPAGPSADDVRQRMEEIRQAMLGLLGEQGQSQHASLVRRVRHSADLQALWYARNDLMGALATLHGEAWARQQIDAVTALFQGMLPAGLHGRHQRRPH